MHTASNWKSQGLKSNSRTKAYDAVLNCRGRLFISLAGHTGPEVEGAG